jgi:secreted trypsin-like serine protease
LISRLVLKTFDPTSSVSTMMSSTLGYLLALTTLFTPVLPHQLPHLEDRIINGTKAIIEDYPFMAAILRNTIVRCSGFIVTNTWVLTCAHCYNKQSGNTITNTVIAIGGEVPSSGSRRFPIFKLVMHPSYAKTNRYYDLALVKTNEEMKFTRKVQPAVLANANDRRPEDGASCTAVGFGSAVFKECQTTNWLLFHIFLLGFTRR